MPTLINLLERFNRKEGFFLIRQALGKKDFSLADDFRTKLGSHLRVPIPPTSSSPWTTTWIG